MIFNFFKRKKKPSVAQGQRMYAAARTSRLSGGVNLDSSADSELVTSLTNLRGRARQLCRDASYAKRAKVIIQNNVIGQGIGMQGQIKNVRGELHKTLNSDMEDAFQEWACSDGFHTGGRLHLPDLERLAIGEVCEAGEVLLRFHRRRFGRSDVPLAVEVIEPELLADDVYSTPMFAGNTVRMGVEVDQFYRPVGYWLRKRFRGEFQMGVSRTDSVYFVPASEMVHLHLFDRFPQTRGVSWFHTVIRKLQDVDGYSEAEIVAARAASNYFGSIKSEFDPNSPLVTKQADGSRLMQVEPGTFVHLAPGEELVFHSPNRPNAVMDPFMRLMLREVAAGIGVSYASLSMDYSQSNYSSSRLALLDDRDLWRVIQGWFIRQFRYVLHREFMMAATLAGQIPGLTAEAYANDMKRYEAVAFRPRGWSWIDPTKEVDAFIKAVRAGFTTVSDVIAKTADGRDREDVLTERAAELEEMHELDLYFDTDPERKVDGAPSEPAPAPASAPADGAQPAAGEDQPEPADGDEQPSRVYHIKGVLKK